MDATAAPAGDETGRLPRSRLVPIVSLGVVGGAASGWIAAASPVLVSPTAVGSLRGLTMALYTGLGAWAWHRRPADRFGAVLVALGVTYLLTLPIASGDPLWHSLGRLANAAWVALYLYAFLSFPGGGLARRVDRCIVVGYAVVALALWPVVALTARRMPPAGAFTACSSRCPPNGLRVLDVSHAAAQAAAVAVAVGTAAAVLATVAVLARTASSTVSVVRRASFPVLGGAILVLLTYLASATHGGGATPGRIILALAGVASLAVPLGFAFAPLLSELSVSQALWRALAGVEHATLSPPDVEEMCRSALGDASMRLGVVDAQGALHDLDGGPLEWDGNPSSATRLLRGDRLYVVLHDPALSRGYRPLVRRTAGLALTLEEHSRLLDDVVLSRRRIAEAEGRERARLEQELHDSAQQSLLALEMTIALLARSVAGSPFEDRVQVIAREARFAMAEVRRIGHGIYPALLVERGLPDAIRGIPHPPGMAIEVIDGGLSRLHPALERALYFAVVEAVQNATKHAAAPLVSVTIVPTDGEVEVSVHDAGRGFEPDAVPAGNGLTGLRDRIESAGGRVRVSSRPGRGTTIVLRVPVALDGARRRALR